MHVSTKIAEMQSISYALKKQYRIWNMQCLTAYAWEAPINASTGCAQSVY